MNRFYILFLISTISIASLNVYAYGYTHETERKLQPSLGPSNPYHPKIWNQNSDVVRKSINYYSCYSAYDGTPLNCSFKQSLLGLKKPWDDVENNAGHDGANHDWFNGHFVYQPAEEKWPRHILFDGDTNKDRLIVEGTTISSDSVTSAVVTHELPMLSVKFMEETIITSPRYWMCAEYCYTRTTTRLLTTYDIGIQGFVKLPIKDASSGYERVRSADKQHSKEEAYYGLPTTVEAIKLIAENYQILSETLLSINDMSLRKGGVFDIKGEFLPPHQTHQEGKDVDINVVDVPCRKDRNLFIAVDMILPPNQREQFNPFGGDKKPTAVNCENKKIDGKWVGGHKKHIDLEFGYTKYIGKGSFY